MFIPVPFNSVNSHADLEAGAYRASCSLYASAATRMQVLLFDYSRVDTPPRAPCAYEVMVINPDGLVRARDFVWLPDRTWRDSDGLKANNVLSLMPVELSRLTFVRSQRLDDVRPVHADRNSVGR